MKRFAKTFAFNILKIKCYFQFKFCLSFVVHVQLNWWTARNVYQPIYHSVYQPVYRISLLLSLPTSLPHKSTT